MTVRRDALQIKSSFHVHEQAIGPEQGQPFPDRTPHIIAVRNREHNGAGLARQILPRHQLDAVFVARLFYGLMQQAKRAARGFRTAANFIATSAPAAGPGLLICRHRRSSRPRPDQPG